MNNGSRPLVMLAVGVVLLMAAALAADVVLSSSSIRVIGPPTSWSGEVLRSEMTGAYPMAAAIRGYAPVSGYAVYGEAGGGYGVFGSSSSNAGVGGYSTSGYGGRFTSAGAYGGYFTSSGYRGLYAKGANGFFDAYFAGNGGIFVEDDIRTNGDIIASGSKAGYVVDLARNDGQDPLQLGDLVVITGATDPVLGEIPVPTVRLADEAAGTGIMGVVDRMFATPAVEKAIPMEVIDAWRQLNAGSMARERSPGTATSAEDGLIPPQTEQAQRKPEPESPGRFVSQGEAEFLAKATGRDPGIAQGAYLGVVTLGAFKAIRVDASYGSILPGDLLVSSPTAGHAMRELNPQPGTIVGKALGSLEEGQGTVPVLITIH